MLILALDTTTRTGSIALARDEQILDCLVGDPALTHGQRLPGDILRLLDRHRLTLRDIELYAVAAGPGSFTGLRIGIATIQGLALVHARPVVAVSSLVALAAAATTVTTAPEALGAGHLIAAWLDARRGEIFGALYAITAPDARPVYEPASSPPDPEAPPAGLRLLEPAVVGVAETLLGRWDHQLRGCRVTFVGDAAITGRDALIRRFGERARVIEPVPNLAPSVARIGAVRAVAGATVAPQAIRPVYVRRPDAELAREQRL